MFRVAHRSSSGALTVFAASGLHTHVVTGRSQVWVGTQCVCCGWWWAVCRSKHVELLMNGGIINSITRLHLDGYFSWATLRCQQRQLELLMMSGVPLETCWAFNEWWNNKFYYKVASWLFILSHTTMHGSMNIKNGILIFSASKNLV